MNSSTHFLKKKDESMSFIEQYDIFNEELNIYRSIIICNDLNSKNDIYNILINNDYSPYKVDNDFEEFLQKKLRIYLMTFDEYSKYSLNEIHSILDEHNMLITYDLYKKDNDSIVTKLIDIRDKKNIMSEYYIWIN